MNTNEPLPPISANENGYKGRILAAAGNQWQLMRPNSVQDDPSAPAHYHADQIQFFDYNFHDTKKVVSSALLDVALLMANISQLKAVYLGGRSHPFFVALITLLSISISLQVVSGLLLIWVGRININEPDQAKHQQANVLTNLIVVFIFILTLANIAVSSLGISDDVPYTNAAAANTSV